MLSLLGPRNPSDQNQPPKHPIEHKEPNQDANIFPSLPSMKPSLFQHITSTDHARLVLIKPYQTLWHQTRVLINQKGIKGILVHWQIMHEKPVLRQVLRRYEVTGKQKETAEKYREKGSSGDVVRSERAQEENKWVGHQNNNPNHQNKVSKS